MDLFRLVYISELCESTADNELACIMKASSARNLSLGISGMLLVSGKNIIQVLEGHWLHVTTLYKKISADPRHRNVECLSEMSVSVRLFPDWGMKLADTGQSLVLDRERIDKTLIRLRLGSNEDRSKSALTLLSEFRAQLMSEAA